MKEPTLFDEPVPIKRPRRHTSSTQSDGYDRVQPYTKTQRGIILAALRAYGRMTRHEIAAVTGIALSSVCGRVAELMQSKEVREPVEGGRHVKKDGRRIIEHTFTTLGASAQHRPLSQGAA